MEKDKIAYEQLIEGISSYVNKCVENSNADKTVSGIVKKIYDDDEGYSVLINGTMYDNVPSIGGTCKVNEIVRILIPQNNYGNMCILKGGSGGSSSGGGSDVRVTVEQTEGTHIATITVNGNENKLYAPNGSGGTTDYTELANKPKINNVELSGNKTLADLGVPSALFQLTSDSTHRTVTDTEKASWNNKANTSDIPTKLSELTSDSTHRIVTDSEKENWNNKAEISDIPTQLSELNDDATHRVVTDTDISNWNNKQNAITNTNKLDYNLIDNTPIIPSQLTDLNNDLMELETENINFSTIVK